MFDGYLFDMDGLLLDTERVALTAFQTMLARVGAQAPDSEAFFLSLIGGSAARNQDRVIGYLPDHVDHAQFGAGWMTEMDAIMARDVPLRPYVREVLDALSEQGARMAVVTSTGGERARSKLAHAGILEHFAHVIGGDEVSENKPHPAPYLMGAEKLGVAATRCAAFEDSDTGIAAAVAAGCHAVQVPDLRDPNVDLPELGQHVAEDLRAAVELLHARGVSA